MAKRSAMVGQRQETGSDQRLSAAAPPGTEPLPFCVVRTEADRTHALQRGDFLTLCGLPVHDDWKLLPRSTPLDVVGCAACVGKLLRAALREEKRAMLAKRRKPKPRPAWALPWPECLRYAACWNKAQQEGVDKVVCVRCGSYAPLQDALRTKP